MVGTTRVRSVSPVSAGADDGLSGESGVLGAGVYVRLFDCIDKSMTLSPAATLLLRYNVLTALTPGASLPKVTPFIRFDQVSLS